MDCDIDTSKYRCLGLSGYPASSLEWAANDLFPTLLGGWAGVGYFRRSTTTQQQMYLQATIH